MFFILSLMVLQSFFKKNLLILELSMGNTYVKVLLFSYIKTKPNRDQSASSSDLNRIQKDCLRHWKNMFLTTYTVIYMPNFTLQFSRIMTLRIVCSDARSQFWITNSIFSELLF